MSCNFLLPCTYILVVTIKVTNHAPPPLKIWSNLEKKNPPDKTHMPSGGGGGSEAHINMHVNDARLWHDSSQALVYFTTVYLLAFHRQPNEGGEARDSLSSGNVTHKTKNIFWITTTATTPKETDNKSK